MGCKQSTEERGADNKKEPKLTEKGNSRPPSMLIERVDDDNPFVSCPDCKISIRKKELDKHSKTCPEREVSCPHSWCTEIMKQVVLEQHIESCMQKRREPCPKCGELFPYAEIVQHKADCGVTQCPDCPEQCIPRIIKYCPVKIVNSMQFTVGPFATEAIEEGMLRRHGVKSGASPEGMQTHFAVARLQHLWRWLKTKAVFEDLVFRVIYKEMDHKKEGFAIFKAQDHDGKHASEQNRSQAPVQAKPAQPDHYFPSNAKVPITPEIARRCIEDIARNVQVPYHAAWRVFTEAHTRLKTMPNVSRVTPPSGARQINGRWSQGGKTVVVGDLHGQLADLLHILHEHGFPSDFTIYVFNGDFVDRGSYGFEVAFILFLLFVCYPKSVFLNRGNHECDYMNEEYGFDMEVQRKFDRNIFKLIQKCFCALPLVTMIGKKILVVHAGIPRRRGVQIDNIYDIVRFRQIPMPEQHQSVEDEIFQDLMWGDPWDSPGWADSDRGVGSLYGPDVTEQFMKNNGIELIIRSHECFQKGYEEHHCKRVISIFSASNYDGPDTNLGAVITVIGDQTDVSYSQYQVTDDDIQQFMSIGTSSEPLSTTSRHNTSMSFAFAAGTAFDLDGRTFKTYNMSLLGNMNNLWLTMNTAGTLAAHGVAFTATGQRERRSRDDVLRMLRERIYARRNRLLAYFTKIDKSRKGTVWKMEWVEVLRHTLNLEVPFFFLRKYIAEADSVNTSRINYVRFLRRFQNLARFAWISSYEKGMLASLCTLYKARRMQEYLDLPGEPVITFIDFCSRLRNIDQHLSEGALFSLYIVVDFDDRGYVTGQELFNALSGEVDFVSRRNSRAASCEPPSARESPITDSLLTPQSAPSQPPMLITSSAAMNLNWDHDVMDQIVAVIGTARNHLIGAFCISSSRDRVLSKDRFLQGMNHVMNGIKRQAGRLTLAHLEVLWGAIEFHAADPSAVVFDDFLNVFVIRDLKMLRPNVLPRGVVRDIGMKRANSINDLSFNERDMSRHGSFAARRRDPAALNAASSPRMPLSLHASSKAVKGSLE